MFDRTEFAAIHSGTAQVTLTSSNAVSLSCEHLVLAAGYESQSWLDQKVAKNRSSYAFVTDSIACEDLGRWPRP